MLKPAISLLYNVHNSRYGKENKTHVMGMWICFYFLKSGISDFSPLRNSLCH